MLGGASATEQSGQNKRSSERQTVNAVIKYRTAKMDHFEQGQLINISESGIFSGEDARRDSRQCSHPVHWE